MLTNRIIVHILRHDVMFQCIGTIHFDQIKEMGFYTLSSCCIWSAWVTLL